MAFFGDINREGLGMLGGVQTPEGESLNIGTRVLDTDGDGRNDLFLVDLDNDGTIDGVVRGFDANGDGVNDTYVQYNEDGSIQSIGRVDPTTGQLQAVYEEPDFFDKLLDFLGLKDLESPEEALFTTFDDPYIFETYGTYGVEVSDVEMEAVVVESSDITETTETEYESMDSGASVVDDSGTPAEDDGASADTETASSADTSTEASTSDTGSEAETSAEAADAGKEEGATPRIVGLEDRSGAQDGSSMWAKVDTDGDGLANTEERVTQGSGEYYADINKDGYNERVATDTDYDGRIDKVDTTGQGSSMDQVDASQVMSPDSEHMVDKVPGENDDVAAAQEAAASASTSDTWQVDEGSSDAASSYDAGTSDSSSSSDSGSSYDSSSSSVDSSSSCDSGSSYDSGGSSSDSGSDTT
jgi:hypothetical protein